MNRAFIYRPPMPDRWSCLANGDGSVTGEAATRGRTAEQLMWLVRWPLPLLVLVSPVGAPRRLPAPCLHETIDLLSFPAGSSSSALRLRCAAPSDRSRSLAAMECLPRGNGNMGTFVPRLRLVRVGGGVWLKLRSDEKIRHRLIRCRCWLPRFSLLLQQLQLTQCCLKEHD